MHTLSHETEDLYNELETMQSTKEMFNLSRASDRAK